jgi:hypothetical protein
MDMRSTVANENRSVFPSLETITICPLRTVTLRTLLIKRSVLIPSLVSMMRRGLRAGSAGEACVDGVSAAVVSRGVGVGCGVTLVRRLAGFLGRLLLTGSGFAAGSGGVALPVVSVLDSVGTGAVFSAVVSALGVGSGSGSSMRAPVDVTRLTLFSVRSVAVGFWPAGLTSGGVGADETGSNVPSKRML